MRRTILVILAFVVVSLIFFFPVFQGKIPFPGDLLVGHYNPYNAYSYLGIAPGGVPNKAQDFDTLRITFPWKEFAIKALAGGELPFWNPYNFAGTPFLANFQGGTFYLLNIFFLFLPIPFAWTIYVFAEPLGALFFTYLLLREFKLSAKSSIFGSIVFAFSSYMTVWLEYGNFGHALIWLPLILLLIEKNLKKPKTLTILALIFSLTMSIFAGYVQISIYVFLFSFVFLLFRAFALQVKNPYKKMLFFLPIFILPPLLASMQLFPTLELFFQSARNAYSSSDIAVRLIPLPHILTTFIPDFFGNPATANYWLNGTYIERVSYIGVVPLFFLLFALLKKQSSLFWFFAIFAGVVYFISFKNPVSLFFYSLPIPFINTTVPTRAMGLFCFAAAICSAFGFDSWQKKSKSINLPLIILGIIYSCLWLSVYFLAHFLPELNVHLAITKRNLILPTGIFISLAFLLMLGKFIKQQNIIIAFLFFITIFDLFYFFHKITPFSPSAFFYPQTEVMRELKSIQGINRSWAYGSGFIDANLQTHEQIFSTDGYDPLFIKNYAELIAASYTGKAPESVFRTDVNLPSGYGTDSLRMNNYRQKILNLTGVKYVLNKIDSSVDAKKADTLTFPQEKYKLIWGRSLWQIYQNLLVAPRIFLTADYQVNKNNDLTLNAIFKPDFNETKTIILNQDPNIKRALSLSSSVRLISYKSNKIEIDTVSDKDALLFISDNYYAGWKVSVDGENGKIYRADYSFRAVPVGKGRHKVIFSYYPESFSLGIKVSLAALVLTMLFAIRLKPKNDYVKK